MKNVDEMPGGGGSAGADAPSGPTPGVPQSDAKAKKVRFRRTKAFVQRIPHPPRGSKRSIALIIGTTALLSAASWRA